MLYTNKKEKLLGAKCPIHGSRRCEVFCDRLKEQKDRKRHKKTSRQLAKKEIIKECIESIEEN